MTARCLELEGTLSETLDGEIPSRASVALLDYPNHENVGDSAIWLGEMAYLGGRGCHVAYHCDLNSYDPRHLRRLPEVQTLLLHGGGNLGDLWQPHQEFRERVLADFPDRRIIQLPQTIHFSSGAHLERTKRVFSSHSMFTLMVRDSKSRDFAHQHFDCRVILCPDSAYALGAMTRQLPPRVGVLWLGRTDHESAVARDKPSNGSGSIEFVDWVGRRSAEPLDIAARAGGELIAKLMGGLAAPPRGVLNLLWSEWARLAQRRVSAGAEMLSRGSVVVTDRLHAHILCTLLDIPHVVLDNNYGKLSSFTATWGTLGTHALWADSASQAMDLAAGLIADPATPPDLYGPE